MWNGGNCLFCDMLLFLPGTGYPVFSGGPLEVLGYKREVASWGGLQTADSEGNWARGFDILTNTSLENKISKIWHVCPLTPEYWPWLSILGLDLCPWPGPLAPNGTGVLGLCSYHPHPACSGKPNVLCSHHPTLFCPSCFNTTLIFAFVSHNCIW
jgi:hypothetical protein